MLTLIVSVLFDHSLVSLNKSKLLILFSNFMLLLLLFDIPGLLYLVLTSLVYTVVAISKNMLLEYRVINKWFLMVTT